MLQVVAGDQPPGGVDADFLSNVRVVEAFKDLPSQVNLTLRDNVLRTVAYGAFDALSSLERLDLSRNQLRGRWRLRGLRSLRDLDLSQNHLETLAPGRTCIG